jgi:hypothetical protein
VPELFRVRVDLGREVPMSVLTTAIDDLDRIAGAGMRLAVSSAESEARQYLSDLVADEGLRALAFQVRRRELPLVERFERDIEYLEQLSEEFDLWVREVGPLFPLRRWPRRYNAALLSGAFAPGWAARSWSDSPWEQMIRQLVAAETGDRIPRRGYRVRSFHYNNPAVAELVAEVGAAAAALGYLLRVITTLGPRRRREQARASAEEQIQAANARDVEDLVDRRIELRRLLLDGLRSGGIQLRPEDINDAFLDEITGAADRLADGELTYEREEIEG